MAQAPVILVADDDEEWRHLISLALNGAGYQVRLAHNGKMVMPLVEQVRPAAIVLDHDLGDMSGAELCGRLKSLPEYRKVPIIVLTARADMLNQMAAGCPPDHFVSKSGNIDELVLVLGTLVPPGM